MTPTEIENLLHRGATRRKITVEDYRTYVEMVAARPPVCPFEKALQLCELVDDLNEKHPNFKRFAQEFFEEAARQGCTVEQLWRAMDRAFGKKKPQKPRLN